MKKIILLILLLMGFINIVEAQKIKYGNFSPQLKADLKDTTKSIVSDTALVHDAQLRSDISDSLNVKIVFDTLTLKLLSYPDDGHLAYLRQLSASDTLDNGEPIGYGFFFQGDSIYPENTTTYGYVYAHPTADKQWHRLEFNGEVNPVWYGARNDGTDSLITRVRFQYALNALYRVQLSSGVYLVDSTLQIDSYPLVGVNMMYTYNPSEIRLADNSNCDVIRSNASHQLITIKNIYVHGNKANQGAGSWNGIYMNGALPTVQDCYIDSIKGIGIYFDVSAHSTNCFRNRVEHCDSAGIIIDDITVGRIENNTIQTNKNGIGVVDGADAVSIAGNYFENNIGTAIKIEHGTNISINDNRISNTGTHLEIDNAGSRVVIGKNAIDYAKIDLKTGTFGNYVLWGYPGTDDGDNFHWWMANRQRVWVPATVDTDSVQYMVATNLQKQRLWKSYIFPDSSITGADTDNFRLRLICAGTTYFDTTFVSGTNWSAGIKATLVDTDNPGGFQTGDRPYLIKITKNGTGMRSPGMLIFTEFHE